MHKRAVNSACRHADNFVMSLCSMEPSVKGFLLRRRAIIGLLGLLLSIWTLRWLMPNEGRPFWMSEPAPLPTTSSSSSGSSSNYNNKESAKGKSPAAQASSQPSAIVHGNPDYSVDLSDLDAPYIGWPLKRVCQEVEPVEGVVWVCDKNWGGMGNIRNFILNCLRYGIEAGATGMVIPEIHLRDEEDITDYITPLKAPFSYMFDEAHFRTAMGDNCPHITLYNSTRDVPYFDATAATITGESPIPEVDPRTLVSTPQKCDAAQTDRHVDRFGERFRAYMSSGETNGTSGMPSLLPPPSSTAPRLFRMIDKDRRPALPVMWAWPVHRDGAEFANTFGTLLRFNPRLMRLGRRALEGMREFSRTVGDEEDGSSSAAKGDDKERGKFLGVHLRSEIDAEKFWPTYAEQRSAYLRKAAEKNLTSVAYVACGDAGQIARFGRDAQAQLGMTVVSKTDVLAGADLAELESLTWDQQAIVDFIVLAGSDYFVGNSRSSFSIFLAQRRHLQTDGLYSRQYKVRSEGFGRSFVVGPKELYFDHWLFIWDAAWP
ncbi:lternative oxidase [Diaporthe amygdali]|uniref:lternative oxidase n=1 Tax=Phomopsis amygdali TaxID=1214568 RepID=UPI0022FED531|nr:lternative oxidase [Diaporthe amygdali]KAJ0123640.1 lternative oxidase [Diaporthe amygdali]